MSTSIRPWSRRSARGYTVIEVMASLMILAIGATGIVGLQKVTAVGNSNARNIATASALGTAWAERLHADAVSWTDQLSLGSTRWLNLVGGTSFNPPEVVGFGAPAADVLGADIYAGDGNTPAFCTEMTLTQLYPDLIRAEIRVFYDRNGGPVTCPVPGPVPGNYGSHALITSLRQNVVQE